MRQKKYHRFHQVEDLAAILAQINNNTTDKCVMKVKSKPD